METKKLLTIALTGILAGNALLFPVMAERTGEQNGGNAAVYMIPAGTQCIEAHAFEGYTNLVRVEIPDGVTEIGDYAFAGCTNLQEIVLPDSLTKIGEHAFEGCSALVQLGNMS